MTHIRSRETPVMWQAGALSLLVHAVFFGLLVMTFTLKSVQPMQVAEVELWDSVPAPRAQQELPKPQPVVEPKPDPQPESKPEPPPPPEPKAEIQVKPKPPVKVKPEPEKKPREEKPKEVKPKVDPKEQAKKAEAARIEAIKQAMLEENDAAQAQDRETRQIAAAKNAQAQAAAASRGAIDAATAKIVAHIRSKMNSQVCGSGNPVLEVEVSLMPTGEVMGKPKLISGSGIEACDRAVEWAILVKPLPVPKEPELFAHFRDLKLKFRPNDSQ